MARFIFLYQGGTMSEDSTEQERNEMFAKWDKWMNQLIDKKLMEDGAAFGFGAKDVSRDGVVDHNDWTQSDVNGFNLINANSLEEAAEIAKGCPALEGGGKVLVRDFLDMTDMMPKENK